MRLYRSGEKTNSMNMAVQVAEFVEENGVVGVKGKRLETGEAVFVMLTDRGDLAAKPRRPRLADFRDKKNNLGVDVGGVIGFDRAYPNGGEGRFYAGWPQWFAGSGRKEDMERVRVNRITTLQIRNGSDRLFGTLSVWQPDIVTEFDELERAEAAAAKWFDNVATQVNNGHGAAILRARNAAGEVVAYTYLYARFVKESKTRESGQATITNFKASRAYEGLVQDAKAGGAVKYDLVPAVNLDISMYTLEEADGSALKATERYYQREDGELIAKGTTFVLDPNRKFVSKVMVHDPYGPSEIDPVLLVKGAAFVFDSTKKFVAKVVVQGPNGETVTDLPLRYNSAFQAVLKGQATRTAANDAHGSEPEASTPGIAV